MIYKILNSCSKGNAVILENHILIHCGVPYSLIKPYIKDIKIVLLTHIHSDHFNKTTLKKLFNNRPTVRFACGEFLFKELLELSISNKNIDVLKHGKIYDYKAFKASPIKLYHDVMNYGFRVVYGSNKAIYATDTNTLKGIEAKNYDLYLLEGNYKEQEIQERIKTKKENGDYIYEYRVLKTHLSFEECNRFISKNAGKNSKYEIIHQHQE